MLAQLAQVCRWRIQMEIHVMYYRILNLYSLRARVILDGSRFIF